MKILWGLPIGLLPVWWAVMVIILVIDVKCSKKVIMPPFEEFYDKGRTYKAKSIYFDREYFSEKYLGISITLWAISFGSAFNILYGSYIYEVVNKIEVVSSMVTGITTIAVTMAVVIILFDKRYYIVFTIREVLQKYRFSEALGVVLFSIVSVSVISMTLLRKKIDSQFYIIRFTTLEIAVIYNIIGTIYIFYVIMKIMFFEQKEELNLLGQLYRFFRVHKVDTIYFKDKGNWSKEAVGINVEYLIDKYVEVCNRKEIAQIDKIEFSATLGIYNQKWYGKAKKRLFQTESVLFAISTFLNVLLLREISCWFILINIIAIAIIILLTNLKINSVRFVIMRLYSDTWAYYFYLKNGNEMFIPRRPTRKSMVYRKYVNIMNSLNAFFYIWLNYIDKDEKYIQEVYKDVIEQIERIKEANITMYLPVFTIGYFLFENHIEAAKVKEIYKKNILDEGKQHSFERMMQSQIFYLTKYLNKEIFGFRETLNKYLMWLKN